MAQQYKFFKSRFARVKVVGLAYVTSKDVQTTGGMSWRVYDAESNLPVRVYGFRPMWRVDVKGEGSK